LSWAQQVEQEDAEGLNLASLGENLEEEQGPATVPPYPAPLPRPGLQPQDIVNAARPAATLVCRCGGNRAHPSSTPGAILHSLVYGATAKLSGMDAAAAS